MDAATLPRYDWHRSYEWNYENAPDLPVVEVPRLPGVWNFCGRTVASPLGVAAGPLLNGRWCLYYAELGFDVLTYKTVRSSQRPCYEMPNLQPVRCGQLEGGEEAVVATQQMEGSWAVSFGMPSKAPSVWREDIHWTRERLAKDKVLSVSVVGTVQPGWKIDQLAEDYARCARWAVQSGADTIEMNLSCPNVDTCDGQLYQQPSDAAVVAAEVRQAIGSTPLIAKIGRFDSRQQAAALLAQLAPLVDALSLTNSIATRVRDRAGQLMFGGQRRGICGEATRSASVAQLAMMAELLRENQYPLELIGVGGVSRAEHVHQYIEAGAKAVHLATAVMVNPLVALEIRRGLHTDK